MLICYVIFLALICVFIFIANVYLFINEKIITKREITKATKLLTVCLPSSCKN